MNILLSLCGSSQQGDNSQIPRMTLQRLYLHFTYLMCFYIAILR